MKDNYKTWERQTWKIFLHFALLDILTALTGLKQYEKYTLEFHKIYKNNRRDIETNLITRKDYFFIRRYKKIIHLLMNK